MLKIGSKIFDGIFSEVNRKKIETFTIWSATIGFIFHLSLVLLNNYSIIDMGNESLLLTNPISAIYTPFSIILIYEIYLLIFFLPRSFTTSVSKQFEIISLILIRRIFGDIPEINTLKEKFNLVISDIAPNITGINAVDIENIYELNLLTLKAAHKYTDNNNGKFIMKTFQNNNLKGLRKEMEKLFSIVQTFKPAASKKQSAEIYLYGAKKK